MDKLDQIQITTTEETAQTAGYALMGARNMLAARASAENICGEFRDNLKKEIQILSHVITAFAKADVIEPLGKDLERGTPAEVKANLGRFGDSKMSEIQPFIEKQTDIMKSHVDRKAGLPVETVVRPLDRLAEKARRGDFNNEN